MRVVKGCTCVYCTGNRPDPPEEVRREEYCIAWTGDMTMEGPQTVRAGSFATLENAQAALDNYPSAKSHPERDHHIEVRQITEWRRV